MMFSTAGSVVETEPPSIWREAPRPGLGGAASPLAEGRVSAAGVQSGHTGRAALYRLTAGPQRIAHRVEPGGAVSLVFVLDGAMRIEQAGREYALGQDQWTLCDANRPYAISVEHGVTQLLLRVPKDMLAFHQRNLIRLGGRALSAEAGMGRLVRQVVGSLLDEYEHLKPGALTELAGPILDLACMAVQDSVGNHATSSVREMLYEKMSGFICRNLRNPDLSVDSIATAFACSKRYVHKIFRGENQTVGELILHSRLERCRRDLADAARADRTITGIAFGWGFNNSAHFSRVFRERYGVSPSAYRARHPCMRGENSRQFTGEKARSEPVDT